MPHDPLSDDALDALFREAHTKVKWDGRAVSDALVQAVYELLKWAPTSANSSPARFVFLRSAKAKERLKPFLAPGNTDKTMAAPVVAIIAYDTRFYENMDKLFPHNPDARNWFTGNEALAGETAFRNGSLQGAYLILAARALGLDCGPMSGFDAEGVNKEFFPDGRFRANFLCNLGYGTADGHHPRSPRLDFDAACQIL